MSMHDDVLIHPKRMSPMKQGMLLVLVMFTTACSAALPAAMPATAPTWTPYPTYTPFPTLTPYPTATPEPASSPTTAAAISPTYTSIPIPKSRVVALG